MVQHNDYHIRFGHLEVWHETGISPTPEAIRHKMKRRLPLANGEHFMRREILIEMGIDDGDGPNIFFQSRRGSNESCGP